MNPSPRQHHSAHSTSPSIPYVDTHPIQGIQSPQGYTKRTVIGVALARVRPMVLLKATLHTTQRVSLPCPFKPMMFPFSPFSMIFPVCVDLPKRTPL